MRAPLVVIISSPRGPSPPYPWSRSPKCSVPFPVADAVAQRVSLATDTDAATDMGTDTDTDAELLIKWLKVQPLELWLV